MPYHGPESLVWSMRKRHREPQGRHQQGATQGPDRLRVQRLRMGSGDRRGLQLPDPGFALYRIRSTAVWYRSRNWKCLEIRAERWKTVVDLWPGDRVLNLNMEVQRS
jgi:hypothetical protein